MKQRRRGGRLRGAVLPLAFVVAVGTSVAFVFDQPVVGLAVLVAESFLLVWLIKDAGKDLESGDELTRRWMDRAQSLEGLATVDPLTGLGNARGFEAEFWRCLARYHRRTEVFSLAIIDVGDAIRAARDLSAEGVVQAAALIDPEARVEDMVCRIDRQRFVVLLSGASESGARRFAERVRTTLTGHAIKQGGDTVYVTASAGVAEWKQGMQSAAELFSAAEEDIGRFEIELRKDREFFQARTA